MTNETATAGPRERAVRATAAILRTKSFAALYASRVLRPLKGPLLVALAYYLGAEAAFYIGTLSDKIFALFWPPNVILFLALIIAPPKQWWSFLAAAFPAHVIAETTVGMEVPELVVAFLTNCLMAVLNAYLVRNFVDVDARLDTFIKTFRYIVITGGMAPALAALGGAFVPILGGGSVASYWVFWSHWFMANAIPNVTLGAGVLAWRGEVSNWRGLAAWRHQIEPGLSVAGLVIVCIATTAIAKGLHASVFLPSVLLLPLPLVLLLAFRFGKKGASGALLVVALVFTWYTLSSDADGVFHDRDPAHTVLALQLFLAGLSLPVLLLAALIDELRDTEHSMRALASSVVRARDEERRRIARELHDSTGQRLVGATWIADRLEPLLPPAGIALLRELAEALQESIQEIRIVAYVLHPPLLDEAGLPMALGNFVEGYVRLTGIDVKLEVSDRIGRLAPDIELVVFRIAQEALTNIARHSQSPTASIRLEREVSIGQPCVTLAVEDAGVGISQSKVRPGSSRGFERSPGVGLTSMYERVAQVGGKLEIESAPGRTVIKAVVPIGDAPRPHRDQSLSRSATW